MTKKPFYLPPPPAHTKRRGEWCGRERWIMWIDYNTDILLAWIIKRSQKSTVSVWYIFSDTFETYLLYYVWLPSFSDGEQKDALRWTFFSADDSKAYETIVTFYTQRDFEIGGKERENVRQKLCKFDDTASIFHFFIKFFFPTPPCHAINYYIYRTCPQFQIFDHRIDIELNR